MQSFTLNLGGLSYSLLSLASLVKANWCLRADSESHPTPPNYRMQEARFGPRCAECEFYRESNDGCSKYASLVKHYMVCDSWKRNPSLPVKFV